MISKIKTFFSTHISDAANNKASGTGDPAQLAAAALLVEIMVTDHLISEDEETTITVLLENRFGLSAPEARELFGLARQEVAEATSLYQFTALVNEHFSMEQKFSLLTEAWQVALADGILDKYEENLIRRLADLLHIRHSQFIKAKKIARAQAPIERGANRKQPC